MCLKSLICFSQQQFDKHDPFFHPSMLENPWAGLEEDFEEVREDLLENAEELILTIPMTISNWMRKIPLDNEMRENMSHDQKVNPNATGDVRSIAKLADTVNQIEQQLKSDGLYAQRHNAETKDTEQPEIKVEQKLLQPSDFEMEQHSSLPDNSNETIDQTETLSVSIDNSSPLRPSMFNRKSINDSISSIQSPPKMSSQPATPDRVVKPHPVIPQEWLFFALLQIVFLNSPSSFLKYQFIESYFESPKLLNLKQLNPFLCINCNCCWSSCFCFFSPLNSWNVLTHFFHFTQY